ncbi:hypothetical protein HPB48_026893 [Haemaphysalis longicornis]|uniref:Hexosyltransferase n=1 Tax=Haemaphysalis longicornis TaxID=44386 RepID=A0A9J6H290_HAELO|nr:hypothetical protein HPB48_026893 [Haemaphysalis longicornis]
MAVGRMVSAFQDFTMKKAGRKFSRMRNTVLILVTTVSVFAFSQLGNFTGLKDLLQDENLKHIEYWSHEFGRAALREGEQYEATRLPHRGGWAVEAHCREGIDVLFFVHACSRKWTRRAALRDTLIEEAAASRFNWAAVFFVGRRANDPLLDAWLNLEADALGDLVVFPFEDGYSTVTPKWVNGMQWVADHCPNVPVIVKLDDDVIVHPFKLSQYLKTELPREPARLHCYVSVGQPVNREPGSRYFVRTDDAPMKEYFTYCSGMAVIMTFNVMRTLLRASPKVHPHPTVGRPLKKPRGPWTLASTGLSCSRTEWCMRGKSLDLSSRLKSRDYALAFQETRTVLVKRNSIGKMQQAPLPYPYDVEFLERFSLTLSGKRALPDGA